MAYIKLVIEDYFELKFGCITLWRSWCM